VKTAVWLVRRFPVTLLLCLVLLACFGAQVAAGGGSDEAVALRLGALRSDRLVDHGEYFRLFTASWLHHGPWHLALNIAALLQLGSLVEYVWGGARLLAFYLLTSLAALLAAAAFGTYGVPVYGASGGLLGLAGLLMAARYIGAPTLRMFLVEVLGRRLTFGVLATFFLGVVLEMLYPMVSSWGHIGGFLCGVGLAFAVPEAHSERTTVRVLLGALSAALVAASLWMGVAGSNAVPTMHADMATLARDRISRAPGGVLAAIDIPDMLDHAEAAGTLELGHQVLQEQLEFVDEPVYLQIMLRRFFEDDHRAVATQMCLDRWLALEPHDPMILNAAAWHLLTRPDAAARDTERAVAMSRKSLRRILDPSSDDGRSQRAAFLDTLGEGLLQAGELDEAVTVQSESAALARELGLDDLAEIEARLVRIREAAG
jgi:membrane associated rhomboid family serine protease